jgi:hypothetical protein
VSSDFTTKSRSARSSDEETQGCRPGPRSGTRPRTPFWASLRSCWDKPVAPGFPRPFPDLNDRKSIKVDARLEVKFLRPVKIFKITTVFITIPTPKPIVM